MFMRLHSEGSRLFFYRSQLNRCGGSSEKDTCAIHLEKVSISNIESFEQNSPHFHRIFVSDLVTQPSSKRNNAILSFFQNHPRICIAFLFLESIQLKANEENVYMKATQGVACTQSNLGYHQIADFHAKYKFSS